MWKIHYSVSTSQHLERMKWKKIEWCFSKSSRTTAILLVNILIALMSYKEWYYLRAKVTSGNKMLCESNVLKRP